MKWVEKFGMLLSVVVSTIVIVTFLNSSIKETKEDIQKTIDNKLETVAAKLETVNVKIETVDKNTSRIDKSLENVNSKINSNSERIAALEGRILAAQKANYQIAESRKKLQNKPETKDLSNIMASAE